MIFLPDFKQTDKKFFGKITKTVEKIQIGVFALPFSLFSSMAILLLKKKNSRTENYKLFSEHLLCSDDFGESLWYTKPMISAMAQSTSQLSVPYSQSPL